MNKDKVLCETPTPGKKPVRIDRWKYDSVRDAIMKVLPESGEGVAFKELPKLVSGVLDSKTKQHLGSVSWYTTTVKLDLECRNSIMRVKGVKPQHLIKVVDSP